jgi:Lrp/AsnC family leucine-responsive transcriptional regulator
MATLDRTNLQLLELLQTNARASISDLARVVNRGESTVRERIASLERDGVLQGYRALVDTNRLGYQARALLRAACDPRQVPQLVKKLEAIPNVTNAMLTTGSKPLYVEVVTSDLAGLEQLLEQRIAPLELQSLETGVVLQSIVDQRPVPSLMGQPAVPLRPGNLDLEAELARIQGVQQPTPEGTH